MAFRATRVLKAAQGQIPVKDKYTVQSHGIWEKIRRAFAVAPERSTGIPLNSQFRNPPPGANDPIAVVDPVTLPAGDIADNPYWKRDTRRTYPKLSVVTQGHAVGLLTVGSEAAPKQLGTGEEGAKQLAVVKEEGDQKGLAGFFAGKGETGLVLGPDGLPPMPAALNVRNSLGKKDYVMNPDQEQSYAGDYPCRTFV